MSKEIKKLADEISFRLLATRKHPDMDWLKKKLKAFKNDKTDPAWIGGVCAHLGRETVVPTWLWRIIFVLTPGAGLYYLLLLFLIDWK